MAIQEHEENTEQTSSMLLLDTLYCEEEKWEDEEQDHLQQEQEEVCQTDTIGAMYSKKRSNFSFFALSNLLEQDLFWEDGELVSLFTKEEEQKNHVFNVENVRDSRVSVARQRVVEWMFKVKSHYGFSALTAILAVNYLDRFIATSYYQKDKPWMIQLVATSCLSLAAKVEETDVPLLLDLQVEDANYLFEAKTIQRMELLILCTLKWKMHPVTPISYLDHTIRRLGLKNHQHWEFLKRCESLLLILVSDSRCINYLPSVQAAAIMMYVIDQVEPFNPIDYQNQLLGLLKISKEKVKNCYELILELSKRRRSNGYNKRKFEATMPNSPSGVIDAAALSSDSSNESWC